MSAVRKPVEEDLLEDQVQLLEHSVPMNKSYQFEVEDVASLKGHEPRDRSKAVQDEIALQVVLLCLPELSINVVNSFLLRLLRVEELLQVVDGLSMTLDVSCA